MLSLKRFAYILFFLLFFSFNSFSAVSSSPSSSQISQISQISQLSQYASSIRNFITNQSRDGFYYYKGKHCTVHVYLSRDGSFTFNNLVGSPDLCKQVFLVLSSIKKLPPPPSDYVYQKVKSFEFYVDP
ncbi:hypothetical protein AAE121_005231 [Salmonella enterica]